MRRVVQAFVCIFFLAAPPAASADGTCDWLRAAEATGIVVDHSLYSFAADYWASDPAGIPVFTYEAVEVPAGATVSGLMSSTSFLPDKYNLDLVAALNPNIPDLSIVSVGQNVVLPNSTLADEVIDGYQFWPKELSKWSDTTILVSALDDASNLVDAYASQHQSQEGWAEVISMIDSAKAAAEARELESFQSIEGVVSAYQGAQLLSDLLQRGLSEGDLDPDAVLAVAYAAVSMPSGFGIGSVDVIVRTVSPTNDPMEGLRMFRVSDAEHAYDCWDNKIEFQTRSYEAQTQLRVGTWVIWAENEAGQRSKWRKWSVNSGNKNLIYTVEWEN
jgi:hypothetical protein